MGEAPIKSEGKLHSAPTDKANLLNQQFKLVFVQEDTRSKIPQLDIPPFPGIDNLSIDTAGIAKLLRTLKCNKAPGPNQLPNTYLQPTAEETAPILAAFFNQTLRTVQLTADWLTANVSPIFKKGDKHLPSNYRPVSLTSVSCKLLEHIIVKHIMNHVETYNILTSRQHRFRSGHSCESQLIITAEDLLSSVDTGKRIDMSILDFSKAFDMVPHARLMGKLELYGIRGDVHRWISTFLSNRTQKVVPDGFHSDTVTVDSGVLQGTVFGPILFLLIKNDLPAQVKSYFRLFADDCLIYIEINSIQDSIQLQAHLTSLGKWAETWRMRFNVKKCYIFSTGKDSTPYFYQLNDHILETVSTNLYLGVVLSEDLSFSPHISNIVKKASRTLGFLQRNLRGCPARLKELSYFFLVRSTLEYASSVWDPHLQKDIDNLERTQRIVAHLRGATENHRITTSMSP